MSKVETTVEISRFKSNHSSSSSSFVFSLSSVEEGSTTMSSTLEADEDLRDVFRMMYADDQVEDWAFSDDEEVCMFPIEYLSTKPVEETGHKGRKVCKLTIADEICHLALF